MAITKRYIVDGDYFLVDASSNYLLEEIPPFIMTINASISAATPPGRFKLIGYNSSPTPDAIIDWGDNTTSNVTTSSYNITHIYPSTGLYTVKIWGSLDIYSTSNTDVKKIVSIDQWGDLAWTNNYYTFYNATNLLANYTDSPNLSNSKIFDSMFYGASKFNGPINFYAPSAETFIGIFAYCSSLNSPVTLIIPKATSLKQAFYFCTSFNQPINIDVSAATDMSKMFNMCTKFNQDISLNTSATTNMSSMFQGCTALKRSLAHFDITSVSSPTAGLNLMLSGCDINDVSTTTNYDDTLVSWASQAVNSSLNFHGGTSRYSCSTGKAARDILTGTYGWTITDGGAYSPPFIISQPIDVSAMAGSNALFTVDASSECVNPTYQWYTNPSTGVWSPSYGARYQGATTKTLTVVSVLSVMSGYSFKCRVSSAGLSLDSSAALLTVY